ncbi:MAG: hypothetical protein GXO37_06295 [Chloroflexi bacterium]|nr:hypothetical protein [Chloroflexota bacterium]
MSNQIDLAQLFQMVTQNLSQKREDLNEADTYNHDHGDHVVEVFELLTQVAKENPHADTGELLELASQLLKEKRHGTARAYAQNLDQGARRLRGQPVTQESLPLLLEALLGSAEQPQPRREEPTPPPSSGGGLGDLLGMFLGGGSAAPQREEPRRQEPSSALGSLLGMFLGGGGSGIAAESQEEDAGLDMGDLMRAGAAFLQASQSGKSTTEAALDALVAATGMGQTPHRAQSTKLVVQAIMQAAQVLGKQ